MEVDLEEGAAIITFTERDTGPWLHRVRHTALNIFLSIDPTGRLCYFLKAVLLPFWSW